MITETTPIYALQIDFYFRIHQIRQPPSATSICSNVDRNVQNCPNPKTSLTDRYELKSRDKWPPSGRSPLQSVWGPVSKMTSCTRRRSGDLRRSLVTGGDYAPDEHVFACTREEFNSAKERRTLTSLWGGCFFSVGKWRHSFELFKSKIDSCAVVRRRRSFQLIKANPILRQTDGAMNQRAATKSEYNCYWMKMDGDFKLPIMGPILAVGKRVENMVKLYLGTVS